MALNKFIFKFCSQPDPGGYYSNPVNRAREKGHPINFALKDDE